jgi:hypothetical protein
MYCVACKHTHTQFTRKTRRSETTLKTRVSVEENIKMNLDEMDVNWNILAKNRDQ